MKKIKVQVFKNSMKGFPEKVVDRREFHDVKEACEFCDFINHKKDGDRLAVIATH